MIEELWEGESPLLPPESALAHLAAIPLHQRLVNRFHEKEPSNIKPESSASAGHIHPLQKALWAEGFEVPVIQTAHGLMVRLSAQAYNHLDEYQQLANTLTRLSR